MFKCIVAGGRDFFWYEMLEETLDRLLINKINELTIISGMAKGADTMAVVWAQKQKIPIIKCPANWDKYGKSAGYKRNVEMAEQADALIAFWDGKSKGTKHMIDIAKERKLITKIVSY